MKARGMKFSAGCWIACRKRLAAAVGVLTFALMCASAGRVAYAAPADAADSSAATDESDSPAIKNQPRPASAPPRRAADAGGRRWPSSGLPANLPSDEEWGQISAFMEKHSPVRWQL